MAGHFHLREDRRRVVQRVRYAPPLFGAPSLLLSERVQEMKLCGLIRHPYALGLGALFSGAMSRWPCSDYRASIRSSAS